MVVFVSGVAVVSFDGMEVEEGGWINGVRIAEECFIYACGEINGDGAKFETGQVSVKPASSDDGLTRKLSLHTASWIEWK